MIDNENMKIYTEKLENYQRMENYWLKTYQVNKLFHGVPCFQLVLSLFANDFNKPIKN